MSRKIAFGIDESPVSLWAFNWAMNNFCRKEDEIILFVVPHKQSLYPSDFENPIEVLEADDDALDDAEMTLRSYADICRGRGIAASGYVLPDIEIAAGLVRKAEELSCNCLILGSRNCGAVARFFIGSVGDSCVHASHCPVVICKTDPVVPDNEAAVLTSEQRRFVIALDDTDQSEYAFDWAMRNVVTEGDTVCLVTVLTGGTTLADVDPADPFACTTDNERAKRILDGYEMRCERRKVIVSKKILEGKTGPAICAYAKEAEAAMVVVGSNEKGFLGRAFLGSVSDYCCHHAPCAVMVCKKPIPDISKKSE